MPDKVAKLSNKQAFQWEGLNLQAVLLAIGFIIMVAISGATVFVIDRAAKDDDDLTRTLNLQDRLTTVLLAMRRARKRPARLYADAAGSLS